MELVVDEKWRLGRRIGGKNRAVHLGEDINTKQEVAFKLERVNTRRPNIKYSRLQSEYKVYKSIQNTPPIFIGFSGFENIKNIKDMKVINTVFGYIRKFSLSNNYNIPTSIYFICIHYYYRPTISSVGIPKALWFGREGDFNVMVMDILGPSLEDLFNFCTRKFSLKTTLLIADQMLARIEHLHSNHFIHRRIHPENFLIGLGRKGMNIIYIIDFRSSKKYRDDDRGRHIPYVEGKTPTATSRFSSINNHLDIEQSRRDDLESIGYVLLYFMLGKLPWQGLHTNTKTEKWEKVKEIKINTSLQTLCKDIPKEFEMYLKYSRELKFDERPNYAYCRQLFTDLFFREGYVADLPDHKFDWIMK